MTTAQALGARLRHLRKSRQMTLSTLGALSGVSLSTISKIENGTLSPTLDKVLRLADGLEMSIGQLIGDEQSDYDKPAPNSRMAPSRQDDGIVIDTDNYEYKYLCSELKNKRMVPIRARIKTSDIHRFGGLEEHGGEEFLIVLKGVVEVHTEFYAPVTLQSGECIYLDSTMGHAYLSTGAEEAEVICVCTDPQRLPSAG
ncbi:(S)-2-hydroxypropylphosphonic acid epoxidase (plasmid) [Sulfitobacter sp. THAF37]|uniref:helix-turn-helix domain-containing protein n=1 Tax=Sulfitobacter sp. THAF37 TaxID=2587855 RepID=UPI001268F2F5|nr:XRE family transcriptional regulator [Sulfitobacter sp. THAF37]QFT61154.1 (S)-2-hydroxypropylphosphonic acid epoxidase [Sulfitobacter sp. THAF37]